MPPPQLGADKRFVAAVVLRDHRPGEVEGGTGNVRVDVHTAGKDHHARGVKRASALDLGDNPAVADADVSDLAVDVVGGVVDLAARDPNLAVPGQRACLFFGVVV